MRSVVYDLYKMKDDKLPDGSRQRELGRTRWQILKRLSAYQVDEEAKAGGLIRSRRGSARRSTLRRWRSAMGGPARPTLPASIRAGGP